MASAGFQQCKTFEQLEQECHHHPQQHNNKKIVLLDFNVCDDVTLPEWVGNRELHKILLSQYMRSYEDVCRGSSSLWGSFGGGEKIAKFNFLANVIRLKLRYQYDFYVIIKKQGEHQQENDFFGNFGQRQPLLYRKLKCCGGHEDDYGGSEGFDEDDVDLVNTYILRNLHMLYSDDGKGTVLQSSEWGSINNHDGTTSMVMISHDASSSSHHHGRASKIQRIN